jgi:hypothetical protein
MYLIVLIKLKLFSISVKIVLYDILLDNSQAARSTTKKLSNIMPSEHLDGWPFENVSCLWDFYTLQGP